MEHGKNAVVRGGNQRRGMAFDRRQGGKGAEVCI